MDKNQPNPAQQASDAKDDGLAAFTEYFCRNYPGPDTIIGRPEWHAPKLFRAAKHAIEAARELTAAQGVEQPRMKCICTQEGAGCTNRCDRGQLPPIPAETITIRSSQPIEPQGAVVGGMMARAYEVVHHDPECPSIGGNGDKDCQCDAVPFLRDLEAALPVAVGAGEDAEWGAKWEPLYELATRVIAEHCPNGKWLTGTNTLAMALATELATPAGKGEV